MKKLFRLFTVSACALIFSTSLFSQEIDPNDTTAITPTRCLAEYRQLVSINVLQFTTGTANVNYEIYVAPQFSMKFGVGTVLGSRILFKEAQQACIAGGIYGMVEPRWYFPKASQNCFIQYGLQLSYKYWNYTGKQDVTEEAQADYLNNKAKYENDADYSVISDNEIYYSKANVIEHLGGVSFFGKATIAGGLTSEFELGLGVGTKYNEFYITPNIGVSFGWTFDKINAKIEEPSK